MWQTPSFHSYITSESTFSYSAVRHIWCRWYLIGAVIKTESSPTHEQNESHKPASFPTQIDSQTEQKVCFSCQLHLWTAVVSKPVRLPPLHLALSSALPRFPEVSATRTAPSRLSFLFFFSPFSLPSSIKSPCCICFLFGSRNLQLQLLLKACCNFRSQRKSLHFSLTCRLALRLQVVALACCKITNLLHWSALEHDTKSLPASGLLFL